MVVSTVRNSYFKVHIAVLLWGFTAIFGDLISLSALTLVWWRVTMTSGLLVLFPKVRRELSFLSWSTIFKFGWIGTLVGLHWVCFYGSIKMANASVALVAYSTLALFTAFLEPVFTNKSMKRIDVLFSIFIIPGILLIAHGLDTSMLYGFGLGILSSLLLAIFGICNKKNISDALPLSITIIEVAGSWMLLSLVLPFLFLGNLSLLFWPSNMDWIYLILLSVFCTILPFILHLSALKNLSVFATSLAFNMEPVYGIILAAFILKDYEDLNNQFYIGSFLLFSIVFMYPLFQKNEKPVLKSPKDF